MRQELKNIRDGARWGLSPRARAAAMQLLEQVITADDVSLSLRLQAVDSMVKIDALDVAAERSAAAAAEADAGAAGVTVFVLPPNGTEATGRIEETKTAGRNLPAAIDDDG